MCWGTQAEGVKKFLNDFIDFIALSQMAQPNESNWTFVGSSLDAEAYLIFNFHWKGPTNLFDTIN